MMKPTIRRRISLTIYLFIGSLVLYVWVTETRASGWMMRDRYGLSLLRHFTTLSNLFQGLASALYMVSIVGGAIEGRDSLPRAVRVV